MRINKAVIVKLVQEELTRVKGLKEEGLDLSALSDDAVEGLRYAYYFVVDALHDLSSASKLIERESSTLSETLSFTSDVKALINQFNALSTKYQLGKNL